MYIIFESVRVCLRVSTNISIYQRTINLNNGFLAVNQEHWICLFLSKANFPNYFKLKLL